LAFLHFYPFYHDICPTLFSVQLSKAIMLEAAYVWSP